MPILTRSARRNSQTASEGVGVPQPDHEQELPPVAGQTERGGGRGKRGGRRGGRGHTRVCQIDKICPNFYSKFLIW